MIIIETTTRERLVLVPEERIVCTEHARDATPADLERAGYVLEAAGAEHIRAILVAAERPLLARAEKAERERDTARAELARLTAPAEGEPTDEALRDAFEVAYRDAPSECCHANAIRAIYRLGVAHERARQQPAQDRATDEELERVYSAAYARAWESEVSTPDRGERAGLRAVAAHVRAEMCLVTRAVGMGWYTYLCPQKNEPSNWDIETGRVIAGRSDGGAILHGIPAADVPATLARLLGEVAK